MARVTAELQISKKSDMMTAIITMQQLANSSISLWHVPDHANSSISLAEAAKGLSRHGKLLCTLACRNIKTVAEAKEKISALSGIQGIEEFLAVTGDEAQPDDISVFKLIKEAAKAKKTAAAAVFTRKGEGNRMAKKAAMGATAFYTQPVFPSNWALLVRTVKEFRKMAPNHASRIQLSVLIPFKAALCRKLAREKPGFITDTGFIQRLKAAETAGRGYEATIRLAMANIEAALCAMQEISKLGIETGIHLTGLRDYDQTHSARQMLRQIAQKYTSLSIGLSSLPGWKSKRRQSQEGYYTR